MIKVDAKPIGNDLFIDLEIAHEAHDDVSANLVVFVQETATFNRHLAHVKPLVVGREFLAVRKIALFQVTNSRNPETDHS